MLEKDDGPYIREDMCARCGCDITNAKALGTSGLYFPGPKCILLCEPCFFDEDAQIDAEGTNDLPETLARYLTTLGT